MNTESMRQYLECVADQRLLRLGIKPVFGSENPFAFMELQDVQELTNFFERRASAYQVAVEATSPSTTTSETPRHTRGAAARWGTTGPRRLSYTTRPLALIDRSRESGVCAAPPGSAG